MADHPANPESSLPEHTVRVQQLFVQNQNRLYGFILSLLPDFVEAQDILQEAFLVITRKADTFKEGSNFLAWALQICRLKVFESLRRRKRADVMLSEEVLNRLTEEVTDEFFAEMRAAAVRVCLDQLAPKLKRIVRLRYYGRHGPMEIASQLDWTPNAVNVALSRARKLIHDCVDKRLQEP